MNLGNIIVIVVCLVVGYVVVSLLMNIKSDDLRPPPPRGEPKQVPPSMREESRPPTPRIRSLPAPRATPGTDWTLLLDVPRSSSVRDIEAAFRRQAVKAEASGDGAMLERLKQARDAALAEKKKG